MMYMCMYPGCVYEQCIQIVIGWYMAYMCVHYVFTQMTRIKGLENSSTLVSDVEAGVFRFCTHSPVEEIYKILFFLP